MYASGVNEAQELEVCEAGCACIDQGALQVSDRVSMTEYNVDAWAMDAAASGDDILVTLGDGCGRLVSGDEAATIPLLDSGLPLALIALPNGNGFLMGCDNGTVRHLGPNGKIKPIVKLGKGWVEHIALNVEAGLVAASMGRNVYLLSAEDFSLRETLKDHPSTVTGLSFSPDGSQIAVSRYNGISIWPAAGGQGGGPMELTWKGSHTAVSWSPNGKYIVSATQENELHGWNVETMKDMKMSGYPAKIRSLSWTADSAYLAVDGADTVTAWPFANGGPEGKAPQEFGFVFNGIVTHTTPHPTKRIVAAGYNEGTIMIGDLETEEAIIAKAPGGGAVTALAFSTDGTRLIGGTEDGNIAVMDISEEGV